MYQYIPLSNLPRSTNFLNSKNQPFHATQNKLKASVFLFEHARLHGKDPVPTVHPGRVSEDSVHTAARLYAFRVPLQGTKAHGRGADYCACPVKGGSKG